MGVGNTIRDYRTKRKISQEELGEAIGVSRQAISKWETDEVMPSAANLVSLSQYFEVSIEAFLPEDIAKKLKQEDQKIAPETIENAQNCNRLRENKKNDETNRVDPYLKEVEKTKRRQAFFGAMVKIVKMIILFIAGVVGVELIVFLIFYR